jgi:hypothetical protein
MWMKSQKTETVENAQQSSGTITGQANEDLPEEITENIDTIDAVQAAAPESSRPEVGIDGYRENDESRVFSTGALAAILGQLVGYFTGRADVDDLDVLSFSLHHLFCRVDFLFRKAFSALMEGTVPGENPQVPGNGALSRQHTWNQLHTINRTLDRMEPLCHLLSDATECVLDAFDISSAMMLLGGNEQPEAPSLQDERQVDDEQNWLRVVDQEHWEKALATITESLVDWENSYHKAAPFAVKFAHVPGAALTSLPQLDSAFATLLDSAGAIFGDILPSFRTISSADDAAIAALLFDLMQQSDQLLVQFETTLEPLNVLLQHFSIRTNGI